MTSALQQFTEIGLEVNIAKCKGINIENGLFSEEISTHKKKKTIKCLKKNKSICYLWVNFSNKIIFKPLDIVHKLTLF